MKTMFRTKRGRVPEGGAINDEKGLSAEEYGEIMLRRLGSEYRRFAAQVLAAGKPPEGGRVLELGPGPGWVSVFLAETRPDLSIAAVDASPDMVRACGKNFAKAGIAGRAKVLQGRAEAVSKAVSGPFDLVYSRDSLHHWDDPQAGFAGIAAVLAPGGILVLGDGRRDLSLGGRLLVEVLSRAIGKMGAYWRSSLAAGYTPEELRFFLAGAGFEAADVRGSLIDLFAAARKAV